MRIPEQVSLYPVNYVKKLVRLNRSLVLGVAIILGAALLFNHNSLSIIGHKNTVIEASSEKIETLQEELAELQKYKQQNEAKVDRVTSYMRKVNPGLSASQADNLARLTIKNANRADVKLNVALAVFKHESSFNCKATSPTGPIGCMQIAYTHWGEQFGVTRKALYQPETNIRVGTAIIKQHLNETGSYEAALRRYYGSPIPQENINYSRDVMNTARALKRIV